MKRTLLVIALIFTGYFLLKHPTDERRRPDDVQVVKSLIPTFLSTNGLEMVMDFEKFRSKAYRCPGGHLTIGYGNTYIHGRKVQPTDVIDQKSARIELVNRLQRDCSIINREVKTSITQNQYDALCSFIYNVGPTNFRRSTLLKKINEKDIAGAASEFIKWSNIKKQGYLITLPGLKKRRQIEKELFLS